MSAIFIRCNNDDAGVCYINYAKKALAHAVSSQYCAQCITYCVILIEQNCLFGKKAYRVSNTFFVYLQYIDLNWIFSQLIGLVFALENNNGQ